MEQTDLKPELIHLGGGTGVHKLDELHKCPCCGMVGDWNDFDVAGADEDCVFCNGCNVELRT